MPWWGFIHIWAIMRIIRGTYFCFTKLIKPLDRWLIKEWMIGDSVITILFCNRPRTWKSYTPHRDQGKGWIKCQLIWIVEEYYVIGMALMKYIWHSSNSLSTTKYLAMCSERAKVKLGGFVCGHYQSNPTANYSPKIGEINNLLIHMPLLLTLFHLYWRKYVLQDTHSNTSGKLKKPSKRLKVESIM